MDHKKRFMDAVRGIPTHHVTQALNTFTPGIDWRGSTKASMAEAYEETMLGGTTYRRGLVDMNLDLLRARSLARQRGMRFWYEVRKQDVAEILKDVSNPESFEAYGVSATFYGDIDAHVVFTGVGGKELGAYRFAHGATRELKEELARHIVKYFKPTQGE